MADLNIDSNQTSLIGGLGMTRIAVYEQSGCPHMHAITSEAYYILSGTGKVEFHDLVKGHYEVELETGLYLQFPSCTIHRLINDGGLTILGMMGNAGLAENGDARIYFGPDIDQDPRAYSNAVNLVSKGLAGALERRDLAVEGYQVLMDLWTRDREGYFSELKRFMNSHLETVQSNKEKFAAFVANGSKQWAAKTEHLLDGHLEEISRGDVVKDLPSGEARWGMCGILHPIENKPI